MTLFQAFNFCCIFWRVIWKINWNKSVRECLKLSSSVCMEELRKSKTIQEIRCSDHGFEPGTSQLLCRRADWCGKKCRDDVTKNGSESILKRWDGRRIYELIFKRIGLSLRAFRDSQRVPFRISAICIISVREGEGWGRERELRNKEWEGAQLQHAASCWLVSQAPGCRIFSSRKQTNSRTDTAHC